MHGTQSHSNMPCRRMVASGTEKLGYDLGTFTSLGLLSWMLPAAGKVSRRILRPAKYADVKKACIEEFEITHFRRLVVMKDTYVTDSIERARMGSMNLACAKWKTKTRWAVHSKRCAPKSIKEKRLPVAG